MGDWKQYHLGELITDIAAGPFGSNLKISCFVPSGFPIIDGANLKCFKVTDNITKFVTEEKARSLARSIAKRNDVIVTISGTLGQIAYIPEESEYEEYLCSQRQFRATFDQSQVDVPFLVYYFHSHEGQQKILVYANQVGVPALYQPLKNFRLIEIPLPPLPTQRKIAAVLGALDDKIENNRKICANLEAQAQAIFKSWFVDFEPFGGKMPQGWKMVPLEGMAERIASGGTPRTKEESYYKGLIRWYSTKELKDCFLFDSEKHISEDAVANSAAKVFPRNTILMAIYAAPTVGRLGILDSESTFNQAAVGIVARREIGYAYLYLQLLNAREGLNLMAVGSCQQNLNVGVVKSYQVLRPDNVILSKFNNLVDGLFDEIRALTKESHALAAMRDALLPKLMSGKIDVEKVKVA